LGALFACCLLLPLGGLAALPGPQDQGAQSGAVIVVTLPGRSPVDVIAQAGGRLVGLQRAPLAALAAPEVGGTDAFAERLHGAGALMVLDGRALLALCGGGQA